MDVLSGEVNIADGMPLIGTAWLAGFHVREQVAGSWVFKALRGNRVLSMSVCFFGGPEDMAERACQKLNTEGGSPLAFHEEPR